MTEEQEVAELRRAIQSAMKTAPAYIAGASIQAVRLYKQGLADAHKVMRKRNAKPQELRSILVRISEQA